MPLLGYLQIKKFFTQHFKTEKNSKGEDVLSKNHGLPFNCAHGSNYLLQLGGRAPPKGDEESIRLSQQKL